MFLNFVLNPFDKFDKFKKFVKFDKSEVEAKSKTLQFLNFSWGL